MIAFLAFFCAISSPQLLGSKIGSFPVEFIANVAALIIGILLELFVMPRVRLVGTVCCPACRRDNAHNSTTCVHCGIAWKPNEVKVYMPDLKQVPAARRAHRIAIAVTAIGALVLVAVPLFITQRNFAVGPYFLSVYYFYELTAGILLLRMSKSLIEHRGSLCLQCAYPLEPTMIQCPECGTVGDVAGSRDAWSAAGLWTSDEGTAREMAGATRLDRQRADRRDVD